eukprot:3072616-Pleurochrysis_carterae.AAC.2
MYPVPYGTAQSQSSSAFAWAPLRAPPPPQPWAGMGGGGCVREAQLIPACCDKSRRAADVDTTRGARRRCTAKQAVVAVA